MPLRRNGIATLLALAATTAACGAEQSADPFKPPADTIPALDAGGLLGESDGGGLTACATSTSDGELKPLHMVLSIDVSGSMCEINDNPVNRNCANPQSKWAQLKLALSSFFGAASSRGISASVITWAGDVCKGFDAPLVPEVPLPDTASLLATAIAKQSPLGATPTHAAIDGARRYASALQAGLKDGGKVAIAVATDGLPLGCSTLAQAHASAQASNAAGLPVYIIGVGKQATNLKSLAAAGGTVDAFNVSSASVVAELTKALEAIRGRAGGCSLALPTPPPGQTLDLKKVNVVVESSPSSSTIPYSQDCADPTGWKYMPDATAPTGIELCAASCGQMQTGKPRIVKLVLGCETRVK
ncbi:MAG: VWA domain-containing protein [Polyangiaceae bacterium]|nr:VWA domain-containing protein [Polyangiaceae bacterium]